MDTKGNLEPVVIGQENPIAEIKEFIKADRISVIRDFDKDIAYIFDSDGPLMCKQINDGILQVIPDQIVCGIVAVIKLELLKTWNLKYL